VISDFFGMKYIIISMTISIKEAAGGFEDRIKKTVMGEIYITENYSESKLKRTIFILLRIGGSLNE